ncbi:hypothetical protein BSR29_00580 [Boudabousia liubingyangii]|uniref:Uncharacterized protein n=1 Tax=Boudabousia liubingyangii TaxID=1921764 RepID=A0A1Q5PPP9_9ACTO|nr:hypothetical protein [Boudabousia liubingyangii]OKL48479.1 hypothetical protein BSR28_01930 [Boudabousia liubingyangii]OKL49492.1 hypothetical protein BSR29_00580 [Boudabousia liubingyangii]
MAEDQNTPQITVEEEPRTLTIERVADMFRAVGFNFEMEENRIKTGFGNVPMAVYLDAGGDYLVIRAFWWSNLDEAGKKIADEVIAEKHANTFFPTYFTTQDSDGYQVVGDVNLFVGPTPPEDAPDDAPHGGVTDAQLGSFVGFFEMLEKELDEVAQAVTERLGA